MTLTNAPRSRSTTIALTVLLYALVFSMFFGGLYLVLIHRMTGIGFPLAIVLTINHFFRIFGRDKDGDKIL